MDIQTIQQEKNDSLKSLAEVTMKVSDAKAALSALKQEETEYLVEREKKTHALVASVMSDSQEILKKTQENYGEVKSIVSLAKETCDIVVQAYDDIHSLTTLFDKKTEEWQKSVLEKEKEFSVIKKNLDTESVVMENEKKNIEKTKKALQNDRKLLNDRKDMLERTITRLNVTL